jgi:hypothetical protein
MKTKSKTKSKNKTSLPKMKTRKFTLPNGIAVELGANINFRDGLNISVLEPVLIAESNDVTKEEVLAHFRKTYETLEKMLSSQIDIRVQ